MHECKIMSGKDRVKNKTLFVKVIGYEMDKISET